MCVCVFLRSVTKSGRKSGGCGSKVGQDRAGGQSRQVGDETDLSRGEDELHAKTQSCRCLHYSLKQEEEGKENRNNIKLEVVLTHNPVGHHTVNRLSSDKQVLLNNTHIKNFNQTAGFIASVNVLFA